jgi:hypothetical protein
MGITRPPIARRPRVPVSCPRGHWWISASDAPIRERAPGSCGWESRRCSPSRPPDPRTQRQCHRREQRGRHGEARQDRLHGSASLSKLSVVLRTGGWAVSGWGDPWLCVPASQRVCPGQSCDGEQAPSVGTLRDHRARTNGAEVPVPAAFGGVVGKHRPAGPHPRCADLSAPRQMARRSFAAPAQAPRPARARRASPGR